MTVNQKPDSEIPRLDPMHAPCGMGYRHEFCGAAFKSMMTSMNDNEDLWRLPGGGVCQAHGFAHTLVGYSACVNPCSESMKKVAYGPIYQGDVDMECLVFGVHVTIENMSGADERLLKNGQISKNAILDSIKQWMLWRAESGFIKEQRLIGRKGSFYIGQKSNRSMFDVQKQYRFDNEHIYDAAKKLAAGNGESESWEKVIQDQAYYIAEDGQRHYYRADFDFENDIGIKIMIDRIGATLFELRNNIWGVQPVGLFTTRLVGADVLEAMKRGSDIPANPYFEEQFYADSTPALAAE